MATWRTKVKRWWNDRSRWPQEVNGIALLAEHGSYKEDETAMDRAATQPLHGTPGADTQPLRPSTRPLMPPHRAPNERALAAAALRDIGQERQENQDHCFAQILCFPTDHADLTLGLFVVADGMGGHHGGAHASKLALSTIVQTIMADLIVPLMGGEQRAPQPIVHAAVQAANEAVYTTAQAMGSDMGTTCTVVLLYDQELVTAHVGDSRALLIGSGVRQLTVDHSAVGRLIAIGALTPEEAREHPLRNHLYRTVGQQASITVDVATTTITDERFLLLCSDGLWGLVSEDDLIDIVQEAPTVHAAARDLIARANQLGGHDNISAVVVALPSHAGTSA